MTEDTRTRVAAMTAATAGRLYDANFDPEVTSAVRACADLCWEYNRLRPSDEDARRALIDKIVGSHGERFSLVQPFYCDYGKNIHLGEDFFANRGLDVLDAASVIFGHDVYIAPNCVFSTAGHPFDTERRNAGLEYALPITVGDNVWIGMGVLVCPGVTIGSNVVIGAGSVVAKDIPSGVVAVGNPCRVLREIGPADVARYELYVPEDAAGE